MEGNEFFLKKLLSTERMKKIDILSIWTFCRHDFFAPLHTSRHFIDVQTKVYIHIRVVRKNFFEWLFFLIFKNSPYLFCWSDRYFHGLVGKSGFTLCATFHLSTLVQTTPLWSMT